MSTKSKRRAERRHPSDHAPQSQTTSSPTSLRGEQRVAAGELMGAVLNLVTLGAIEAEPPTESPEA